MQKAIFPASFDPIHNGHIDIARRASKIFDELLIGVYDRPQKKLIFDTDERVSLVKETFADTPNIHVVRYSGLTVKFCQEIGVHIVIRGLRVFSDFEYEFRMAHANHFLAPDVETIAFIASQEHAFLSSSTVKEIASLGGDVSAMVPPHVAAALKTKNL
ncbi:MAG: pantetheine-phosphate adenylyltransferase [Anaerolineales bacterium]|nr:pantetheine-phosphate adenylyltransferase [Anaerolineales bacterium]